MVADEDRGTLETLRRLLEDDLGHDVVAFAITAAEAADTIAAEDPDMSFVMVHEDDEHALELIAETVTSSTGPVVAYGADGHDDDFVQRAAARGIDAYTRSEDPATVQGVIEVALRHHRERQALTEKVEQLEDALERRATIERAKGILMERHRVGEKEAFELLRGQARSTGRRVADVAGAVVDGHALLP